MARRKIAKLRILVTGASQGIGRALAVAAARRGARVLAAARSVDLLAELAGEVRAGGGTIETITADVTSAADRHKMVETAQRAYGGLDVLINNAGIGATGHFVEAAPQRLRALMEVNFFGVTETTRVFLPLLRRPEPGHRQHLLGRGQARHPGTQRILGQQVRHPGFQ